MSSPSRAKKKQDALYTALLQLTQLNEQKTALQIQNQLFVGYNMSFDDLKLYYLLLSAYNRRARGGRPFFSLTDIAKAVTAEAKEYKNANGYGLISTNRTDLFKKIKRLTQLKIEDDLTLIMRAERPLELRIHPGLWSKKAPYRKTWKKHSYFPTPLLKTKQSMFSIKELGEFIEPLAKNQLQTGTEISHIKQLFGTKANRRWPSIEEAKADARKLLDKLMAGQSDTLLCAFSKEELFTHLKQLGGDLHGEK